MQFVRGLHLFQVTVEFNSKCTEVDLSSRKIKVDGPSGEREMQYDLLVRIFDFVCDRKRAPKNFLSRLGQMV